MTETNTSVIEHLKLMMEASAWDGKLELSDALANIEQIRAALTETLAPTFQPDWADFENGRECGRLEAAQPNIQNYPEKDISQPEQTESIECDCGRIHKKTRYGWASNEAAQPVPPHECKTDAEKLAYAAGWWKVLEANRAQPAREPLKQHEIISACYSFRHDFGLLPADVRESLVRSANDWAKAFGIGGGE